MKKSILTLLIVLSTISFLHAQVNRERYFPAIKTDGKITGKDTLVAIKGLRVEGPSLLKSKVTGNDTLVAIKGLRVEGPSLLKSKVTGNDTLVAIKGLRVEDNKLEFHSESLTFIDYEG